MEGTNEQTANRAEEKFTTLENILLRIILRLYLQLELNIRIKLPAKFVIYDLKKLGNRMFQLMR